MIPGVPFASVCGLHSGYVAVRIRLCDIEETSKELVYDEPTSELNPLLERGGVHDFEFAGPARVDLSYYRTGSELFFRATLRSRVSGQCARCLEGFELDHDPDFTFIMVPRTGRWADEQLDGGGDAQLMWYEGEEVDVSPLLRERLLLALPTQALCRPDCRGLCVQCGADQNLAACGCVVDSGDPRLAVLRTLRRPNEGRT